MVLRNRQPNSGTKPTCPMWVAQKKQKTKKLLQVFRTRGSTPLCNKWSTLLIILLVFI